MPLVLVRPSVLRYPRDLKALVHTVPHIRQTAPDFRLPRTGPGPETVKLGAIQQANEDDTAGEMGPSSKERTKQKS
ncbi:UNVERIFIED_CONTAM: hypothetical protein FKN15_048897 [Acipenser sinensis]